MSLHLSSQISHGVIDNTQNGHTYGQIWLHGHETPIELTLTGNCLRDIAGSTLHFKNPHPKSSSPPLGLPASLTGTVGDMTASKKIKKPAFRDHETELLHDEGLETPFEWANCLYLEWFCPKLGRILIQHCSFQLSITSHAWQMNAEQEDVQKIANLQAMRQFVASLSPHQPRSLQGRHDNHELSEQEWESILHHSERLSKVYHEVVEKYGDDPDADFKQAFVMGWDGLLETMAFERIEHSHEIDAWAHNQDEDPANLHLDQHPLYTQINDLTSRAIDIMHPHKDPHTPEYQLVLALTKVSDSVNQALNCPQFQKGLTLAYLKRSLHWLNEALRPCALLMEIEDDPDQLTALAHLRCSSLEIRDEIINLRRTLR